MLSVICPIYNEEKYIEKCILSILEQDYPKDDMEVLFVDGNSTDKTKYIINQYIAKYSFIKLLNNPNRIVPYAMNIGLKNSCGEIIIRLDGHCEYPKDYFSRLVNNLKKLNADNVGGVFNTLPINKSAKAIAISECLKSPFGMGNSAHRIGAKDITQTDTVPFGCFKREIFDQIGYYDTDLIRNQDDELNGRIIKNGGKIYIIPDLIINYYSRDKISKIRKMFYQYGLFKPLVNKKLGSPATIRQFVPLCFLLALVIGGILSIFSKILLLIYLIFLTIYFSLSFIVSLKKAIIKQKISLLFFMPMIFLIIHLSYGWGYLVGIFKIFTKQKIEVKSNR